MIEYQIFLNILIYSIVPTLVVLYLNEKVKGSVKNSFDKKLLDLKQEHSLEIAKFENDLNFLKAKENFKFTKLHEKRLEVFEKTFQYLNETLNHLQYYISPMRTRDVDDMPELDDLSYYLKYCNSQDKFFNYFLSNKIYFNKEISTLLTDYFSEADKIFVDYEKELLNKATTQSRIDTKSLDARSGIADIILPIRNQIEDKFRELLGD